MGDDGMFPSPTLSLLTKPVKGSLYRLLHRTTPVVWVGYQDVTIESVAHRSPVVTSKELPNKHRDFTVLATLLLPPSLFLSLPSFRFTRNFRNFFFFWVIGLTLSFVLRDDRCLHSDSDLYPFDSVGLSRS